MRAWRLNFVAIVLALAAPAAGAQDAPSPWVPEVGTQQYFAVIVEDVDRSVEWYQSVFGVEKIGGSVAEDGSWRIENLRNDRLLIEIIRDDRSEKVNRALGFRKVGFQVPDVEVVATLAERYTGERPRVLDFPRFESRIIQLKDPDGNVIQLSSHLQD